MFQQSIELLEKEREHSRTAHARMQDFVAEKRTELLEAEQRRDEEMDKINSFSKAIQELRKSQQGAEDSQAYLERLLQQPDCAQEFG